MSEVKMSVKKRIIWLLTIFFGLYLVLIGRLVYVQVINSQEYQQKALAQWTKDIPIPSKRGIIYDRNAKKLALRDTAYEIYVNPAEVKDREKMATALSQVLELNKQTMLGKISEKKSTVTIKKKVDADKVKKLREMNLDGIVFIDDNKRLYPQKNFASYILGFTNVDNQGQDGVELTYEKYLNGFPGRYIKMTDARGQELPDSNTKYYEPQDGLNLVLTVDEVIQHFAEKAVEAALSENKAKRVTAVVMEPKTGDILAMAVKGDYDSNDPRKAPEELKDKWASMTADEQYKELCKIWRNPAVSDVYEPGSTFKIITSAAGLEEGVVKPESQFVCTGSVTVAGKRMKCWKSYNPHGPETFVKGVQNSCNPVFIAVGQSLGAEKFYKYIKAFGFGSLTNIKLPGEATGIVRGVKAMGPVELANISFGQGISVTPIQLITAVSAVANGGYLMEPRIAKKLIDSEGKTVHEFQPRVVRQVISSETATTLRGILESVVSEGTGKNSYLPGYRVAGKTGTAQKAENGRYAQGKYIASFVGFAPANDPKIAVLVIIDEPGGFSHFGGTIAAPVVKSIIGDTLNYLNVQPQYTEAERAQFQKPTVKVPDIRNMTVQNAAKELGKVKLGYTVDGEGESEVPKNAIIVDQMPKPGVDYNEGGEVLLYIRAAE